MKNSNKGFSVTEVLVATVITVMLFLAGASVMSFLKVKSNKAMLMSENRISTTLGDRFLWIHFKNATPSFNLLRGPSFTDDTGQQFYDYVPDYPISMFPASARKRTLTLTPKGTKNSIIVLVMNTFVRDLAKINEDIQNHVVADRSNLIYADPAKFYDVTGETTGTINTVKIINFIKSNNPKFLSFDNGTTPLVNFYSPALIRELAQDNDNPTVPNAVSIVSRFDGSNFIVDTFGGLIQYRNATNLGIQFSNIDEFIRQIPPAGGGIPPFMVRAVRLLKYDFKNISGSNNPNYALRYSEWNGSDFVNPVIISDRVKKLVLGRPDITDPLITVTLQTIKEGESYE